MAVVRFCGAPKIYKLGFLGRLGSVMDGDFDGHMDSHEFCVFYASGVFGEKCMRQNSRRCVDVCFHIIFGVSTPRWKMYV